MQIRTGLLILAITLAIAWLSPLFAQSRDFFNANEPTLTSSKNLCLNPVFFQTKEKRLFRSAINTCAPTVANKKSEEKEQLREEWKEFLGIDVFYPYYKVREVESAVANKTTVAFFNFKGKAEFEEGSKSFKYIFKKKF